MRFVWVEGDGSSSIIRMARRVCALGFSPSHWMWSCEASAYGIALDGHVIMFEHGYGSLTLLLTKSMSDSTGQFVKQKSHNVDKCLFLKLVICLRFVF